MNNWNGIGRLIKDPEMNGTVCKFTIAIDRRFQKQGEEKKTDFINCVAFGNTAEKFIMPYFKKGMRVGITGELNINKYEDKFYTSIKVNEACFADSQKEKESFVPVQDEELPF